MARSAIRVRFVFNQRSGTAAQTSRQQLGKDFATSLANDLIFRAAEQEYEEIRKRIQTSFAADAKRELAHLTALYRRHIIGAGKTKSRPAGMLGYALGPSDTGVGDDDGEISIAESLPSWAPRSSKYMKEKKRNNWGAQWFSARGALAKNMKADTLLAAFGPIRVTIKRNLKTSAIALGNVGTKKGGSIYDKEENQTGVFNAGGTGRLNVATVRVFALTNITPAMLPALRNGDPATPISDKGNPGLWQLMRDNISPAFASSVSGFSSRETGRRYRPTLEPFLAFYLTRSIPNALALRLQEGKLKQRRFLRG